MTSVNADSPLYALVMYRKNQVVHINYGLCSSTVNS